ncbi:PREDICTED: lipid phosphate phosphohydrolase 1-like isoform X2 [Priapulus caudatus]|uniref:Lipid phosphate phosphohydrolase 1-like isoform X2 n=1 Tax=Priapulus caudatus TaxID=37621 RepID=A0ABM1FA70_PRICU|nr:PREDICTED: lipid phosphate phosphohydrolase 1-like isoform X2 [Priapulus caudatus]
MNTVILPYHNNGASSTCRTLTTMTLHKVKIAIDLGLFLAVAAVGGLVFFGYSPRKRGFFCDDEELKYTFHYDSVPAGVMFGVSLGFPVIVVIFTEWLLLRTSNNTSVGVGIGIGNQIMIQSATIAFVFFFGYGIVAVTTEILKSFVGRKRPYFFQACQPDFPSLDCTSFVENYQCTIKDEPFVDEAEKSFPSGHASLSVYAAAFIVLYLQTKLSPKNITFSSFLLPVIQVASLTLATLCCLSRINDNKHFWSDVLVGSLLGAGAAIYMVSHMAQLLKRPKRRVRWEARPTRAAISDDEETDTCVSINAEN